MYFMNKKQWVAPSAQLVQFAANEYCAVACSQRQAAQVIGKVSNVFAFLTNGNDSFDFKNSSGQNKNNTSYEHSISSRNDVTEDLFNDVVSDALTESYDQAVQSKNGGNSDWLGTTGQWVSVDHNKVKDGWYATINNGSASNETEAYIFYGSETTTDRWGNTWTNNGYYVTTRLSSHSA